MHRSLRVILIPAALLLLAAAGIFLWGHRHQVMRKIRTVKRIMVINARTRAPQPAGEEKPAPDYTGETIDYDIVMGGLRIGESHYRCLPRVKEGDTELTLMEFSTTLAKFSDTEKIYSDPRTFLPKRVERSIVNLMLKEHITETYDQEKFIVTIVKHTGKSPGTKVIQKQEPVNNPILLPYYVRQLPGLEPGAVIIADLPLKRFELTLTAQEEITVPAGKFSTYRFESTPKQIVIWITADSRRIPVKLKGSGLLGYTLVMRSYKAPDAMK